MASLAGKKIVIIGGTSGIGLAAALSCAQEGAELLVAGRDDNFLEQARLALPSVSCMPLDLFEPDGIERIVEAAQDAMGRIDGLYHVAGGSGRSHGDGPLDRISDEGWQFTLEYNLMSLMRSNRAVVRRMLAQKSGGSIVNIGSVLATYPSPGHFATHAYAAAKSAVIGMTRSCAAYYASERIRFNVLAAGLTDSPMAQRAAKDEEIRAFARLKQPIFREALGNPDELSGAAVFLLSDASSAITGQVLNVDGGWSVSEGSHPS